MNEKLKKFQDLSLKEKEEVLKWRNHPEIRKYLFNKKEISLKEHLQFIESLKEKNDKIYLKVSDLGVVNFHLKKQIAILGIHKNPKKQKVGKILLNEALKYAFKTLKVKKIILEVFEENKKAINLYKQFGFTKIAKNDNLIKMELKYEDWKNRYE